jgi:hypothetical protein
LFERVLLVDSLLSHPVRVPLAVDRLRLLLHRQVLEVVLLEIELVAELGGGRGTLSRGKIQPKVSLLNQLAVEWYLSCSGLLGPARSSPEDCF